jgi:hypothetical protein
MNDDDDGVSLMFCRLNIYIYIYIYWSEKNASAQ